LDLPADKTALTLLSGTKLKIKAGKENLEILPDEVEVRLQAKPGYTVAAEGPMLAALVTEMTDELVNEGLAREFVRHAQEARKQAGLDIADRIRLSFTATDKLKNAIKSFREYIKTETLALDLNDEAVPNELPNSSDEFDGEQIAIWIQRVEKP
jgi:isoleucyl-tRNA synthetase